MANLTAQDTFPHARNNVKDESATYAIPQVILPLHRPLFPLCAAKGRVNKIGWYTGSEAITEFGAETFDVSSKFFRNEQLFLQNGLFDNQGCFLVRFADPDAKTATLVIECQLTKGVEIQQYEHDDEGNLVYDVSGNPVPSLDGSNNPIKEPGVQLKFSHRTLKEEETYDTLKPRALQVGEDTVTIYPIAAAQYTSPCAFGNKSGFKFYCNYADQENSLVSEIGALLYTFAPVEQPYDSDTPGAIQTVYGSLSAQFMMKPKAYDRNTSRQMSSNDTIFRLYTSGSSTETTLPYNIYFYEEYFETIAQAVVDVETNNTTLTSPYMVDICSLKDLNGVPYHHAILDTTGNYVSMSSMYVHYLSGGDDGDTSQEKFEELYRAFLNLTTIPEVEDNYRYPITHLYDVGYSADTKFAMCQFMGKIDTTNITMAAQDSSRPLYTMDEAISAGTALRAKCTLTPESELYGTGTCRASIFVQAGHINDKNINNVVPFTLWLMQKRAILQNSSYFKGDIAGDPQNKVTIFRDINFTPYNAYQKQINWDNSLNYAQYAKMNSQFFASVQTVYKNQTSMLSDVWFVDAVVAYKFIVNDVWTKWASVKRPLSALAQAVTADLRKAAVEKLGAVAVLQSVSLYQTEEEVQLGTTYHIRSVLVGDSPARIFDSDIIVRRSNLTVEE